jgi:2-keto-4-pentenoate hydratase
MKHALNMKHVLKGPGVLPVDVISAPNFVVPAIEIVDFRVMPEPGFGIIDTVADLAACGAVVLGANPRRLDAIDVRRVHGELKLNGKLEVEGEASAVLGNPVHVRRLACEQSRPIRRCFRAGAGRAYRVLRAGNPR